jgi:hypothetical protein
VDHEFPIRLSKKGRGHEANPANTEVRRQPHILGRRPGRGYGSEKTPHTRIGGARSYRGLLCGPSGQLTMKPGGGKEAGAGARRQILEIRRQGGSPHSGRAPLWLSNLISGAYPPGHGLWSAELAGAIFPARAANCATAVEFPIRLSEKKSRQAGRRGHVRAPEANPVNTEARRQPRILGRRRGRG